MNQRYRAGARLALNPPLKSDRSAIYRGVHGAVNPGSRQACRERFLHGALLDHWRFLVSGCSSEVDQGVGVCQALNSLLFLL